MIVTDLIYNPSNIAGSVTYNEMTSQQHNEKYILIIQAGSLRDLNYSPESQSKKDLSLTYIFSKNNKNTQIGHMTTTNEVPDSRHAHGHVVA